MSYLVYGFRQPHTQWEGILALDIWYQLLYKAIDAEYPFKDEYIDRNPMSKLKVKYDDERPYVDYFGQKLYKDSLNPAEYIWYGSETDVGSDKVMDDDGYAYIWDKTVW